MKRAIVLGAVTATVLLTFRALSITSVAPEPWDARPFDHPSNGIERALLLHDGQTYAALAQDPLLRQPELFYGDTDEQSYRAARPMLPWLAWATSFGRVSAVPPALFALSIAGIAAMAAATATLARALGRDPASAWVVLALPGSIAAMSYIGLPDALAAAGVVAGFIAWRAGRVSLATAAFAAAALTRETALLAVAALLLTERRRAVPLLWSAVPFLAWLVVIRIRADAWPFEASSDGARYTMPFAGWWKAIPHWGLPQWAALVVTAAVVAAAWPRLPRDLRWFCALWGAVATCFGWQVWFHVYDFPRVLLPIGVVSVVALLPPAVRPNEAVPAGRRQSGRARHS